MWGRLRELASIVRHPVAPETRKGLQRAWERVPEEHRHMRQMYGRHGEGCGATIGMMPRCDFACTGCYLGDDANRIPYEPIEAIKEQIRVLRPVLGKWGNLQLTDGEVTLRPEEELVEIIQFCKEIELLPMLMTHGDTFRRRPGMLERLVEAGLREVSIHIDTTQRGRVGSEYKYAETEEDLMPLRDEFVELIKDVRQKTGVHLRAATTMTVTRDNVDGVPAVMEWLRDGGVEAFDLISFQPIAQVGRTEDGLGGGVSVEKLWERIADGLYGDSSARERLERSQMWLGHPACNRYVPGVVVRRPDEPGDFHPVGLMDEPVDRRMHQEFYGNFGGLSFRADNLTSALARLLGMWLKRPVSLPLRTAVFMADKLKRWAAGGTRPGLLWNMARRRVRTNGFMIVSHHFMSAEEIDTEVGQERIGMCVFHVPVDGEVRSMCEVNATGIRDRYYEEIASGKKKRLHVVKNKDAA